MEYGVVKETPEYKDVKINCLCQAASAIVSSLSHSKPDHGVQLAIRLLKPYAMRGESPELVAFIGSILQHYSPSSDALARTLVSTCMPLVKQKSVQILEGCTDILLYRYRGHKKNGDIRLATMILLDGIDMEGLVFPERELGSCYRALATDCHSATLYLLTALAKSADGDIGFDPHVATAAIEMKDTFEEHQVDIHTIPEAMQLVRVLSLFEARVGDEDPVKTGNRIAACLEFRSDPDTGVFSPATSLSLHLLLLQVALLLLKEEEAKPVVSNKKPRTAAVFDTFGVGLLLQTLERLRTLGSSLSHDDLCEMSKAFLLALAKAVKAENSEKQFASTTEGWDQRAKDISAIQSSNFHVHDYDTKQLVVESMLDI